MKIANVHIVLALQKVKLVWLNILQPKSKTCWNLFKSYLVYIIIQVDQPTWSVTLMLESSQEFEVGIVVGVLEFPLSTPPADPSAGLEIPECWRTSSTRSFFSKREKPIVQTILLFNSKFLAVMSLQQNGISDAPLSVTTNDISQKLPTLITSKFDMAFSSKWPLQGNATNSKNNISLFPNSPSSSTAGPLLMNNFSKGLPAIF